MAETIPTTTQLNPYLTFDGDCKAAIDFYHSILGGEITMQSTFAEMPPMDGMEIPDSHKDKIMHTTLVFDGCTLLASDSMPGSPFNQGNHCHLSVYLPEKEKAVAAFNALAEGGQVTMPFNEVFWGGSFGSLVDKFGIAWMVSCS